MLRPCSILERADPARFDRCRVICSAESWNGSMGSGQWTWNDVDGGLYEHSRSASGLLQNRSRSRRKTGKAATSGPAEVESPLPYSAWSKSLSCRQIKVDLSSIWEIWLRDQILSFVLSTSFDRARLKMILRSLSNAGFWRTRQLVGVGQQYATISFSLFWQTARTPIA
jgi:hypothetical protein